MRKNFSPTIHIHSASEKSNQSPRSIAPALQFGVSLPRKRGFTPTPNRYPSYERNYQSLNNIKHQDAPALQFGVSLPGKRGFTLIELLIVVSILAILATLVLLVLNPAELLAQTRDSQRLNDLDTIRGAVNLYLTDVPAPDVTAGAVLDANSRAARFTASAALCPFSVAAAQCTFSSSTVVNGSGWVLVDLTQLTGGSPLAILPQDPVANATYFYAYAGDKDHKTYELDARLESVKYRGKMITDGGNKNTCATFTETTCLYETGNDPGLDL